MALASSGGPIVFGFIDNSTAVNLLVGIINTLTSAGIPNTTVSGVTVFTLISQQGLEARLIVKLAPLINSRTISLQMSDNGGTVFGAIHYLSASNGATPVLQIWCNNCQVFISNPGHYIVDISLEGPWYFACGILFIPQGLTGDCSVNLSSLLITDMWWSVGQNFDFFDQTTFRACTDPFHFTAFSRASFNGGETYTANLMNTDTFHYTALNQFRLLPVSIAYPYPHFFGSTAIPRMLYYNNDLNPLLFDPFIMWGDGTQPDGVAILRGQLYDSFQGSAYSPVDEIITLRDTDGNLVTFINYMGDLPTALDRSRYSSLFLLLGVGYSIENPNMAYVY